MLERFSSKIESVQYAALGITVAISCSSCEKLYQELGLEHMDMFIKRRPIFDEMLQVLLLLKNYHLSAYENC